LRCSPIQQREEKKVPSGTLPRNFGSLLKTWAKILERFLAIPPMDHPGIPSRPSNIRPNCEQELGANRRHLFLLLQNLKLVEQGIGFRLQVQ